MLQATRNHLDIFQNTITDVYSQAAQQKKSAFESATSSITGPRHGMISGDPFVLGFYEARAERETEAQLSRAKMIYESAVSTIDYNAKQTVNKVVNENALQTLFPAIVDSVVLFFSNLLQKYTSLLSSHGHLDLSCLEGVDMQKSNQILRNLAITNSKNNTIFSALKVCPFNTNVFCSKIDNRLSLASTDIELLDYLGATDIVCAYVLSKIETPDEMALNLITETNLLQEKYNQYFYHIQCVADLKRIPFAKAAQLALKKYIFAIFEPLIQLSSNNNQAIITYLDTKMRKRFQNSISSYDLNSYINSIIIPPALWEFLQGKIEFEVSENLSTLFHSTIQNSSDLQSFIVSKLTPYRDKLVLQGKLHSLEKELKSVQDEKEAVISQQPADQRSSRGFLGLFIVFLFFDIACVVACCILDMFGFIPAVCLVALLILALYCLSKWRSIADYEDKVKQFDDTITRLNGQLAEITTQLKTQ